MNLENIKEIIKEIAQKRNNYERRGVVDQIEASWKTNQESKHYDKNWDEHWDRGGDDSEADLVELELVLERICPSITYLQVQKLLRSILETDSEEVRDYYERYTLNLKFIKVHKLYNYLKFEGLIK
jgi:hypothetical protein